MITGVVTFWWATGSVRRAVLGPVLRILIAIGGLGVMFAWFAWLAVEARRPRPPRHHRSMGRVGQQAHRGQPERSPELVLPEPAAAEIAELEKLWLRPAHRPSRRR